MKWLLAFPVFKGLTLGSIVVAVVQSGLSPFAQALIIALVSAIIGAVGMIVAALLTTRSNDQVLEEQKELAEHLSDIKRKVGASHRQKDDPQ